MLVSFLLEYAVENKDRIPGYTEYSECVAAFRGAISPDDLGDHKNLFINLESLGVDPITAGLVRNLKLGPDDYISNVVAGLKIKWEYEWRSAFPELAKIEDRFKFMKDDRFSSDPAIDQIIKKVPDMLDAEFDFEDPLLEEEIEAISSRSEAWVESEEGLTVDDLVIPIQSKQFYIVTKMGEFIKANGKQMPFPISDFLLNSPANPNNSNRNNF